MSYSFEFSLIWFFYWRDISHQKRCVSEEVILFVYPIWIITSVTSFGPQLSLLRLLRLQLYFWIVFVAFGEDLEEKHGMRILFGSIANAVNVFTSAWLPRRCVRRQNRAFVLQADWKKVFCFPIYSVIFCTLWSFEKFVFTLWSFEKFVSGT